MANTKKKPVPSISRTRVCGGALASFAPPANCDWLTRLAIRSIVPLIISLWFWFLNTCPLLNIFYIVRDIIFCYKGLNYYIFFIVGTIFTILLTIIHNYITSSFVSSHFILDGPSAYLMWRDLYVVIFIIMRDTRHVRIFSVILLFFFSWSLILSGVGQGRYKVQYAEDTHGVHGILYNVIARYMYVVHRRAVLEVRCRIDPYIIDLSFWPITRLQCNLVYSGRCSDGISLIVFMSPHPDINHRKRFFNLGIIIKHPYCI